MVELWSLPQVVERWALFRGNGWQLRYRSVQRTDCFRKDFQGFLMTQGYTPIMKTPEYREGPEARENFERGMIALFKVPKDCHRQGKKAG
jgi:hypothetical protein